MKKITGDALGSYVDRVAKELGATDERRLGEFLTLSAEVDERFTLSVVFSTLFPDKEKGKALESFKQFRRSVNSAGEKSKCSLRIHIDSSKSGNLEDRRCWFEVDPKDNAEAGAYAKASSGRNLPEGSEKSNAMEVSSSSLLNPSPSDPKVYKVFVSYAQLDIKLANSLLKELKAKLKALTIGKPYSVEFWRDVEIIAGQKWYEQIISALNTSDVGLLLLSTNFLASDFIQSEEIPYFVSSVEELKQVKTCVPLMLSNFPLDQYASALGSIQDYQIYKHRRADENKYAWDQCGASTTKNAFLDEFAAQLLRSLDEMHGRGGNDDPPESEKFTRSAAEHEYEIMAEQKSKGHPSNLKNMRSLVDDKGENLHSVEAVSYLLEWAQEKDSKREFMAVLGEFGMGKTTTLHQLSQELLKLDNVPVPYVFDLRFYHQARKAGDEITLEAVIKACVHAVGRGLKENLNLKPEVVINAVREQGAIAVFDGLDEVMNSMDQKESQKFVAELWSILPVLPKDKEEWKAVDLAGRGKIIMSCRSHFFRDVTEQNGLYTGHSRESINEEDRQALLILPFTSEQILSYLKECLGESDAPQVYQQLEEIHNLLDLAKRPLLLNMIREIVPDLEAMKMQGQKIQGVNLYSLFLSKHMDRDAGKHVFTEQHKLRLMEALAVDLWISQQHSWAWENMEEWLDDFLCENESIRKRYSENGEVLNQDFRNATAVVRGADDKECFKFAHTSLREYFLACWMHRSLVRGELEKWEKLPMPSIETLDFFGQLVTADTSKAEQAMSQLAHLMESNVGNTALIGFHYLQLAHHRSYQPLNAKSIDLSGANLSHLRVSGSSVDKPLILPRMNLSEASIVGSVWTNVEFRGGSFGDTQMSQSKWRGCSFKQIDFRGAKVSGARFRSCVWDGIQMDEKEMWKGAWVINGKGFPLDDLEVSEEEIRSMSVQSNGHVYGIKSVAYDAANDRYLSGSEDNTLKVWDAKSMECIATLSGHKDWVNSVAYDAVNDRYLSGSSDNTLKVWDAKSMECMATLSGHKDWVNSVAYDAVNDRYLSGSSDNTLKVWDAKSMECMATLSGHKDWVRSVAYDAANDRYLSGSDDNTLKVWDAKSMECMATLSGHKNGVNSVAYDAANDRYLSGSDDNTLKVWDAKSMECIATLSGHKDWVRSVAYDAANDRYLSGSSDNTLKVWDAKSMECMATLSGHKNRVNSVAYDTANDRYLSGSFDNTLKVWDAKSMECIATLSGHKNGVFSVAYDAVNDRYLSGSSDNTLKVWDAKSMECIATLSGHKDWVNSVTYDAANDRYLSGSDDNTLKVWDAKSMECIATLSGHKNWVRSVAYDAVNDRYLSGSSDNTLKVWDAKSMECIATLSGHKNWVRSVAYDATNDRYLSGSDDSTLKVWDAKSMECIATLSGHGNGVNSVAYDAANDRYLSGSDDNTLKVWDAKSMECIATLSGHKYWVNSVAYDAANDRYLSGSFDSTVKVWDAKSMQCMATLSGHKNGVKSVAYDAANDRYLSGSDDNTLKVWDAKTYECLSSIHQLDNQQWAVEDVKTNKPTALSETAHEHLMWVTKDLKAVPFEALVENNPF